MLFSTYDTEDEPSVSVEALPPKVVARTGDARAAVLASTTLRAARSAESELRGDGRELELSVGGSDEDFEPAEEPLLAQ